MKSIYISNKDIAPSGMYVAQYHQAPLRTRHLSLGVKKILFPKGFFKDQDTILEFGCQDLTRPDDEDPNLSIHVQKRLSSLRMRENYEYQRLFTVCSADLSMDADGYHKYEPLNIRYHKLYPAMDYQGGECYGKQELNFYFRDINALTFTPLQIDEQFMIELDVFNSELP